MVVIVNKIDSIWDWNSISENLKTKKNSELKYQKWDKTLDIWVMYHPIKKRYYLEISEKDSRYIKNDYKTKREIFERIRKVISSSSKPKSNLPKSLITKQEIFEPKDKIQKEKDMIKKVLSQSESKSIIAREYSKVLSKKNFWESDKIQRIPIVVWWVSLFGGSILFSWGVAFWFIILSWVIIWIWSEYIWKKINKYDIKIQKLKKYL